MYLVFPSCSFNLFTLQNNRHSCFSPPTALHFCFHLIPERQHRQGCLSGSSPVRLGGCFLSEAGRLSALHENVSSAFSRHSRDYFQAHSEMVMRVSVACCVPPSGSDLSSSSWSVQAEPQLSIVVPTSN